MHERAWHQPFDKLLDDLRDESKVSNPVLADVLTRLAVAGQKPVTRAEVGQGQMLTKPSSLSPSVVSRAVAALRKFGLVVDADAPRARAGRVTEGVRLGGETWVMIGLFVASSDERPTQVHGVVTSLAGAVLCEAHSEPLVGGEDLVDALVDHAVRLHALLRGGRGRSAKPKVLGVGVSIAGPVHDGRLVSATHVGVQAGDVLEIEAPLCRRLGELRWTGQKDPGPLPVVVDNDVNLLAVSKTYAPNYPERDLATVAVFSEGVGAALTLLGRVYRGGGGKAGEIGHQAVFLDPTPPEHLDLHSETGKRVQDVLATPCTCGGIGHVDCFAVPRRIERALGVSLDEAAMQPSEVEGQLTWAGWVLGLAGEALGLGLATVVNVVNPSRVLVMLPPSVASAPLFGPTAASHFRRACEEALTIHSFAKGSAEARAGEEAITVEAISDAELPQVGAHAAAIRVLDEFILHALGDDACDPH